MWTKWQMKTNWKEKAPKWNGKKGEGPWSHFHINVYVSSSSKLSISLWCEHVGWGDVLVVCLLSTPTYKSLIGVGETLQLLTCKLRYVLIPVELCYDIIWKWWDWSQQ